MMRRQRATRQRGRKRGLTPATLLMWIIVAGMLVMLVATRFTLDYTGAWLNDCVQWWQGIAR